MKTVTIVLLFIFLGLNVKGQNMTNSELEKLIISVSDSVSGSDGRWQFYVEDVVFICVTDVNNNRMRIISPIIEASRLNDELKSALLIANFHTALDVKYAIANDLLWSAFIHPLRELSNNQVIDGISQVYSANINFGTSFSSTDLIFPGTNSEDEEPEKKENTNWKKQRF